MGDGIEIRQIPHAGAHLVGFVGEVFEVRLNVGTERQGNAYLRTNLGYASVQRREIIASVEDGAARLNTDWHDIPMIAASAGEFVFRAALDEPGVFEAKAFWLDAERGALHWPKGDNIEIKVEPAGAAAANTIYTGFVRQFGINKNGSAITTDSEARARALEEEGYTAIPPSGTFRDMIAELDFIIGTLGFRYIQLLPIHPVPTTYARMGRFGSPFAALDFMNVDRSLAVFDGKTTPLEQFQELVQEVHRRDGRVLLDIAMNHTGWASQLQIHHPEWFPRNPDGSFRSPGAWGVVWEDLSELDYSHKSLWRYVADVFLYWCGKGVDGFRCDAGYMLPFAVWEYVVAKVRDVYPETIFLLEGLGGKVSVTRSLLGKAGLNWAYSEIFQNYNRDELERYLPLSWEIESEEGLMTYFAETHDNNRLAARGAVYARMRTGLCALTSQCGSFAITNGVEWLAAEKIDVHGASSLNWGAEPNLVDWLALLNRIVSHHPAFQHGSRRQMIQIDGGNAVVIDRSSADNDAHALVIVNLCEQTEQMATWIMPAHFAGIELVDILSGAAISPEQHGEKSRLRLEPGQVLCLTKPEGEALPNPADPDFNTGVIAWRLRAKLLEIRRALSGNGGPLPPRENGDAALFLRDPQAAIRALAGSDMPLAVDLVLPRDLRRRVMVPPGMFLLISGNDPFTVCEFSADSVVYSDRSLPIDDGRHCVVIPPRAAGAGESRLEFNMLTPTDGGPNLVESKIMRLADYEDAAVVYRWTAESMLDPALCALAVNRHSSTAMVRSAWSQIHSQYDAIFAVNPAASHPADRRILWTRCRCWVVCKDYSREVVIDNLHDFHAAPGGATVWRFIVPVGRGLALPLRIELELDEQADRVAMSFIRDTAVVGDSYALLPESEAASIIVRPDIESRNFHHKTKAFMGAEAHFPASVAAERDGFAFTPDDIGLRIGADGSSFIFEPEWQYMVPHPIEAERGLDGSSDLFSPGYFRAELMPAQCLRLKGEALHTNPPAYPKLDPLPPVESVESATVFQAACRASRDFIVQRDGGHTVIAGYPWFLDWGRDTLIALRGLIAIGWHDISLSILAEFARFEDRGTLPNMIHGADTANRDTSDAPLWFAVACEDLCRAAGRERVLATDCGGRSIADVLISIGEHYRDGTPNGIKMDPESALIYSPEHFTWMDTQYPAGTPRQGYPIEIQALWSATLGFLAQLEVTGASVWRELKERVDHSINEHFVRDDGGGLSDCLHSAGGYRPAAACTADDHCRPNQLFAVTLGCALPAEVSETIVAACWQLLIPGAIRSLADTATEFPLPVKDDDGHALNDPRRPYWGRYEGDEDTRRKPAYHNGTAWVWPFPSFCEALHLVYGENAIRTALSILASSADLFNSGCAGHLPEILDGDAPHRQKGCPAQAWSTSEVARVCKLLIDCPRPGS